MAELHLEQKHNKTSVKTNLVFQFLYQVVVLVIPLIISPYLTRHLGDTGIGTYSYIYSIAYYFVVFANLGISKHGQRIIASASNQEERRKRFWSLLFVHCVTSFLSVVLYISFIIVFVKNDLTLYLIEGIFVASALFDITWFFYGLQNFKGVVIRNLFVKVAECALIFLFVKSPNDLTIYFLIMSGSVLVGNLLLIPPALKNNKPIRFGFSDVRVHFRPLLVFSIAVVAITMYTVFDKTLIGVMIDKENTAYYEYADKVVKIPIFFISVIGTVMYPKACEMATKNDKINQERYLNLSLVFVFYIGFLAFFGFLALSNDFAIIYYGKSFKISGDVMKSLCALPLIVGLGDVVRTQYLIPNHMDKQYLICIVINAVFNVLLSVSLIPVFGIYGAVIGTISAELFGTIFQLICCKKIINAKELVKLLISFFAIGLMTYKGITILREALSDSILSFVFEMFFGFAVYTLLSFIFLVLTHKEYFLFLVKRRD